MKEISVETVAFFAIVGILIFQQFFYMRQIQKLVDKMMCRSLSEYNNASAPKKEVKIKLQDEYVDNGLRTLDDFQGLM